MILSGRDATSSSSILRRSRTRSPCSVGFEGRMSGVACTQPATPVSAVEPLLDELDAVLVMSVMPGFGGQAFEPSVLEKVRALRAARPGLDLD